MRRMAETRLDISPPGHHCFLCDDRGRVLTRAGLLTVAWRRNQGSYMPCPHCQVSKIPLAEVTDAAT